MKLTYIFAIICLLFTVGSCGKKESYKVYFFQNIDAQNAYHLTLDNVEKGALPYLDKDANCSDSTIQVNAMVLQLSEGKYKYELSTHSGEVVSSGKFKISKNKTSSSGGTGSAMVQQGDDCAAVRLGR